MSQVIAHLCEATGLLSQLQPSIQSTGHRSTLDLHHELQALAEASAVDSGETTIFVWITQAHKFDRAKLVVTPGCNCRSACRIGPVLATMDSVHSLDSFG